MESTTETWSQVQLRVGGYEMATKNMITFWVPYWVQGLGLSVLNVGAVIPFWVPYWVQGLGFNVQSVGVIMCLFGYPIGCRV